MVILILEWKASCVFESLAVWAYGFFFSPTYSCRPDNRSHLCLHKWFCSPALVTAAGGAHHGWCQLLAPEASAQLEIHWGSRFPGWSQRDISWPQLILQRSSLCMEHPFMQRAKKCLWWQCCDSTGPNSRGCQNTLPLIQPAAILSGCLQSMRKSEIQTYSGSGLFVQTCKYTKKKQLGRGWQRATTESPGETRKGASAHSLPAQDSGTRGRFWKPCWSSRRRRFPLGQQSIQGRILAEGCWECMKSARVEGKIAQTSGKQSSTGDKQHKRIAVLEMPCAAVLGKHWEYNVLAPRHLPTASTGVLHTVQGRPSCDPALPAAAPEGTGSIPGAWSKCQLDPDLLPLRVPWKRSRESTWAVGSPSSAWWASVTPKSGSALGFLGDLRGEFLKGNTPGTSCCTIPTYPKNTA